MKITRRLMFAACIVCAYGVAAAPLPSATPEQTGMSSARLNRVESALTNAIESGEIPGAVVMIARDGKLVYSRALGSQNKTSRQAMREDSIFRIYSMTKPIVSVATMMLVEQGKISLADSVSKFIPSFGSTKVGVETRDESGEPTLSLVSPHRPMTVQDLLRHTAGLPYGTIGSDTEVKKLYREANLFSGTRQLAEFANAVAELPLQDQPGTTWQYGHATDILGRVVEVASAMPLDQFLQQQIFAPLGMNDTAFYVTPAKHHRIAEPIPDKYTGKTPALLNVRDPVILFAGGHGLTSTAGDYLRFCQMMLNGGELDGVRILGPRTVRFIASDHLNPTISKGTMYIPGYGYGFGLGFATRLEYGQSTWPSSVGEYFWGGYAGTYFWIDPQERLVVTYMSQEPVRRQYYRNLLRSLVYQAIIE